jgi:hypothetical protein
MKLNMMVQRASFRFSVSPALYNRSTPGNKKLASTMNQTAFRIGRQPEHKQRASPRIANKDSHWSLAHGKELIKSITVYPWNRQVVVQPVHQKEDQKRSHFSLTLAASYDRIRANNHTASENKTADAVAKTFMQNPTAGTVISAARR